MKAKIFYTENTLANDFENEMNIFFEKNPNIEIIEKISMTNKYTFWLILIYKEKFNV